MKGIPETFSAHLIIYSHCYDWVLTSADITHPVFSASAMTRFIRYIYIPYKCNYLRIYKSSSNMLLDKAQSVYFCYPYLYLNMWLSSFGQR